MTVLTMEDRYAQVLLLFGPPPESVWGWHKAPALGATMHQFRQWQQDRKTVEAWQRPLQKWLYEQGITRSPTDGSWIRDFCRWHKEKCNEGT